jgi:hypothetical protein
VQERGGGLLDDGPRPWVDHVNRPETASALEALRRSVVRGCPFAEGWWVDRTAKRLGLEATPRLRGRPKKATKKVAK